MDEQNNTQEKARGEGILPLFSTVGKMPTGREAETTSPRGFSKKKILLINGLAVGVAIICFVVVAVWLPLKGPFFDAPLRSLLTGLGLLGLACPPFTAGFMLRKKVAASPYFEEAFIQTGFNIIGFVCFILGLICIGLGIYALVMRFFGEG